MFNILAHRPDKLRFQILILFIFNTLLVASVAYFSPIRFEVNDDIVMLLISSGKYSGIPDPHLVFINYIYGFALNLLYSSSQFIEWYTVSFLFIHIVALTTILSVVLSKNFEIFFRLLICLLFYSLELINLSHLQFTTTAAVIAFAGIVLLLEKNNVHYILGSVFFIIGSLVRFEAAMLVFLVATPFFFKAIVDSNKFDGFRHLFTRQVACVVLTIFVALTLKYADSHFYNSSPEWQAYKEYNQLRGDINDNPNARVAKNTLPGAINPNDYSLLLQFIPDKNVLDTNGLRLISDAIGEVSIAKKLENAIYALSPYRPYLLLILLIAISLVAYSIRLQIKIVLVLFFSQFLVLLVYVSLEGTLKFRVFVSALLPVIYLPVVCRNWVQNRARSFPRHIYIYLLLLSAVFILEASYILADNNNNNNAFTEQHTLIDKYLADHQKLIVPYKENYEVEAQNPFTISKLHFKNRLFFGGWLTGIPFNTNYYNSHSDFVHGVAIFLNKRSKGVIPQIIQSIRDNYGIQASSKIVSESTSYMIVEFAVPGESPPTE